jgi:hypothetical protein
MKLFVPLAAVAVGALALTGLKKKKKKPFEEYAPDIPEGDDALDVGESVAEVIVEDVGMREPARAPQGDPPNPAGAGPYGNYDHAYWEKGSPGASARFIREHFAAMGYPVIIDDTPMNELGPDGGLGGGDDVPNENVRAFQSDYNAVSRAGLSGHPGVPSYMNGLDEDGLVGPNTLNGLQLVRREGIHEEFRTLADESRSRGY